MTSLCHIKDGGTVFLAPAVIRQVCLILNDSCGLVDARWAVNFIKKSLRLAR
jgi:hypothetical protein